MKQTTNLFPLTWPSPLRFFASKMQAGSTKNTKDSAGRRLGVKKFTGEEVFPDDIIIRQRGFKFHPGTNTYYGRDHTIHSKIEVIFPTSDSKSTPNPKKLFSIYKPNKKHLLQSNKSEKCEKKSTVLISTMNNFMKNE